MAGWSNVCVGVLCHGCGPWFPVQVPTPHVGVSKQSGPNAKQNTNKNLGGGGQCCIDEEKQKRKPAEPGNIVFSLFQIKYTLKRKWKLINQLRTQSESQRHDPPPTCFKHHGNVASLKSSVILRIFSAEISTAFPVGSASWEASSSWLETAQLASHTFQNSKDLQRVRQPWPVQGPRQLAPLKARRMRKQTQTTAKTLPVIFITIFPKHSYTHCAYS